MRTPIRHCTFNFVLSLVIARSFARPLEQIQQFISKNWISYKRKYEKRQRERERTFVTTTSSAAVQKRKSKMILMRVNWYQYPSTIALIEIPPSHSLYEEVICGKLEKERKVTREEILISDLNNNKLPPYFHFHFLFLFFLLFAIISLSCYGILFTQQS